MHFVQRLRKEDLIKIPGIAETLDWVRALHRMQHNALPDDMTVLLTTLGCLLKTREDRFHARRRPRAPADRRPSHRGRGRKVARRTRSARAASP